MTIRSIHLIAAAAATLFTAASAFSQSAPLPAEHIRDQQLRQEQVKAQTDQATARLDAIIADFDRNGLGDGEDVKTLRAVRTILNRLSAEQMRQVIDLLQQARGAGDSAAAWAQVTDAYRGQKTIIAQLAQLLLEYQRQQKLFELSIRLNKLAERQDANLKQAVALAKINKPVDQLDPAQRTALDVQQAEQEALRDEIDTVLKQIAKLADSSAATDDATRKALDRADKQRLAENARAAADDLKTGNLFKAASAEKQIRDTLRDVARAVTPLDQAARLRQAAAEIDRAIADQKDLRDRVQKNDDGNRLKAMEPKQADLVDRADKVARDIDTDAPLAADALREARDAMQQARSAMNDAKKKEATDQSKEALAKLEQAKADTQRSLEQAEAKAPDGKDKADIAKDVKEKIRQLIADQEALAKSTLEGQAAADKLKASAPRQEDMKNRTTTLTDEVLTLDAAVPRAVAAAAREMALATKRLADSPPVNPAEQQNNAIARLREAEKALDQQVAELDKKQEELKQVEKAREKLADAARKQQEVNLDTAKQAAKEQPQPDQAAKTAEQQKQVADQVQQVKDELPQTTKDAAQSLDQAKQAMDQSKNQLDQKNPEAAQPPQQDATENLENAQKQLADRADQLREDLGQQPPPDAQANEQLADAMNKAKDELNQAMDKLPPGEQVEQQKSLQQQQKQLAEDVGKMESRPNASKPVADAQKAAEKAANELADNKPADAAKSMDQAADALKQAADQAADPQAKADLQQTAAKQEDLKQQAEAQAAAAPPDPAKTQEAGEHLEKAANAVADAAKAAQQASPAAQEAMREAQEALNQAAAQAAAPDAAQAQQHAADAQKALAQAQAAMAMAKEGMSAQAKAGPKPGEKADEKNAKEGKGDRKDLSSNADDTVLAGADPKSTGQFIGLPQRDRDAIKQSESEKYPEEYAPMVEQYLRNLSETRR